MIIFFCFCFSLSYSSSPSDIIGFDIPLFISSIPKPIHQQLSMLQRMHYFSIYWTFFDCFASHICSYSTQRTFSSLAELGLGLFFFLFFFLLSFRYLIQVDMPFHDDFFFVLIYAFFPLLVIYWAFERCFSYLLSVSVPLSSLMLTVFFLLYPSFHLYLLHTYIKTKGDWSIFCSFLFFLSVD